MPFRPTRALAAAALATSTAFLGPLVHHHGSLTDLQPAAESPTDGARGYVSAVASRSGTWVVLHLRGLDPAAEGRRFGAHVHVGHCVAGQPAEAKGHYNHADALGTPRGPDLAAEEVWLDFTVRANGTAYAKARVDFTIDPGDAHSVVVHADPTDVHGNAGGRLACLPVHF